MKLLLLDKSEILDLNINYLSKEGIRVVYTYEEFIANINTVNEGVGFTTKAIKLFSSTVSFLDILNAIYTLYKQHLYYFSEGIDSVAITLNTKNYTSILENITNYSELDIKNIFNNKSSIHLKAPELTQKTLSQKDIRQYENFIKACNNKDKLDIHEQEKYTLIKQLITEYKNNESYRLNNLLLNSQRQMVLELLDNTQKDLNKLTEEYKTLYDCYSRTIVDEEYYKTTLLSYKDVINTINQHGIQNLNEDCFTPIQTQHTTYPLKVLYFKHVTSCKYLHTFIKSFAKTLFNMHECAKVLYLFPSYSKSVLRNLRGFKEVSKFKQQDFVDNAFFVNFGSATTILEFILGNTLPIDTLIIMDFTAIDKIHCIGDNVNVIYCASEYEDFTKLGISPIQCVTNTPDENYRNMCSLVKDPNYETYKNNKAFVNIMYEQSELTNILLHLLNIN